jgi:hypothetical protein
MRLVGEILLHKVLNVRFKFQFVINFRDFSLIL